MLYLLIGLAALILFGLIWSYNRLVGMRQLTRNAWSDVDVYLKRRAELIPNLVQSVQGYAQHESGTLARVIAARDTALAADSVQGRASAEQKVTSGVHNVLAIAEAYPQLKASESFLELQRSLSETEKLIASARQYYNACVRDYNTLIEAFPSNVVASSMSFKPAEFFEIDNLSERDAPSVKGLP